MVRPGFNIQYRAVKSAQALAIKLLVKNDESIVFMGFLLKF